MSNLEISERQRETILAWAKRQPQSRFDGDEWEDREGLDINLYYNDEENCNYVYAYRVYRDEDGFLCTELESYCTIACLELCERRI